MISITSISLADNSAEGRLCGKKGASTRARYIRGNMKISVETKVVAAMVAGLMTLTGSALAQGRGKSHSTGSNQYTPTNNPGVNTHISQQGDNRSVVGRTNAEENRPSFSEEKVVSSGREQREERHEAHEQREERHNAAAREERHENREQRFDRHEAHRQREQRYQDKNRTQKTPFDGSLLEVKPSDLSR